MTEREYRQDDQTVGYCPKCGKQLANLLVMSLSGYCEDHGLRFADFTPVAPVQSGEATGQTKEK